jgi:tetratricopeptide (TPR) repeat protein
MFDRRPSFRPLTLSVLLLALASLPAAAREVDAGAAPPPVSAEERAAIIDRLGEMIEARYVFPDTAAECVAHLQARLAAGAFDSLADPEALAERLTEDVQSITHDKHLRVRAEPPSAMATERVNPARAHAADLARMRERNWGFERVERLDGNVGYLDMRFFAGEPEARETAAAAMRFLANCDAVIFDMRKNGGGSPGMIQFVCSYLFAERTHLNSLYWREGDRTDEFWTLEAVPGPSLADVPVFVLTSSYTFSGAEEFSYNLQTRERATLVGETTGGGAHPGGWMPISDRFGVFIPTGRAINPVTGTNWEGTGVQPTIPVSADQALETALPLAREAASARRASRAEAVEGAWTAFEEARAKAIALAESGNTTGAAERLTAAIDAMHAVGQLGEMDVNMLGYRMLQSGRDELAVAVFEWNVDAYPESFNVYDSLAEAHMHAGRHDRAIALYRRSLELEPGNDNAREMIRRMVEQASGAVE